MGDVEVMFGNISSKDATQMRDAIEAFKQGKPPIPGRFQILGTLGKDGEIIQNGSTDTTSSTESSAVSGEETGGIGQSD